MAQTTWMIWDGDCAFCERAMSWFERRDTEGFFTAVPASACPSPPITSALRREAERSVIVATADGRILTGGQAVIFGLERIGWHPAVMRRLARRPWIWAINAGYRIVANHRNTFSRFLFRDQRPSPQGPHPPTDPAENDDGGVS